MFRQLCEKYFYKKTGLPHDDYQGKKNYETIILELFLNVYNKKNQTDFKIKEVQESPDFLCKDLKGNYLAIDITELFGTQKVIDENTKIEMDAIRNHKEYELIQENLTPKDIQNRVNHKDDPDKYCHSKGEKVLVISLLQYNKAAALVKLVKKYKFNKPVNFNSAFLLWNNEDPQIEQIF